MLDRHKVTAAAGVGVAKVKRQILSQQPVAGLGQRLRAGIGAGQRHRLVLAGRGIVGMQLGVLDVDPPEAFGPVAPERRLAQPVAALDDAFDAQCGRHRVHAAASK